MSESLMCLQFLLRKKTKTTFLTLKLLNLISVCDLHMTCESILAIESDVAHITFVGKCLEVLDEYVVNYDGDGVLVLRAELPLPLHPGKPFFAVQTDGLAGLLRCVVADDVEVFLS